MRTLRFGWLLDRLLTNRTALWLDTDQHRGDDHFRYRTEDVDQRTSLRVPRRSPIPRRCLHRRDLGHPRWLAGHAHEHDTAPFNAPGLGSPP